MTFFQVSPILSRFLSLTFIVYQMDKRTGKPKVWIYKDKNTGVPKGEATVTFDDPGTASAAINWFDGRFYHGYQCNVFLRSYQITKVYVTFCVCHCVHFSLV